MKNVQSISDSSEFIQRQNPQQLTKPCFKQVGHVSHIIKRTDDLYFVSVKMHRFHKAHYPACFKFSFFRDVL